MLELTRGWLVEGEAIDGWLCVRITRTESEFEFEADPALAETIWSLARQHALSRLVVELGGLPLSSLLVGQLVLLHKRAHLNGGTLRMCGLTPDDERVLRLMGLVERFPNYPTRDAARGGPHPNKPR